jgi:oligogalacturonide lyase
MPRYHQEMIRSRRWFLSAVPACSAGWSATALAADKAKPSALFRFKDDATEFPILRLTDPAFTSFLPAHYQRALPRHGGFLLYSSDVTGRMQAYRMEAKSAITHQLTELEDLDVASLTLTPDEHSFCCVAGDRLLSVNVSSGKVREVYRVPQDFQSASGMSLAQDGLYAALIEKKLIEKNSSLYRLRLIRMIDGMATTLAESPEELRDPIPRPRRASVMYSRGGGLWLVNYDGQQNYRLRLGEGETGPANWAPDGRSILYLNYPTDPHKLHNIREFTPDTNEDAWIADTSQYVGFERNADSSVLVGASGSKASPYVLLLVRAVKRELTLCEHRSSDPNRVSPIFSPTSQNVFFGSDQHGKPAIYSVAVEKLVAETDSTQ